jgi:putative pantetheine hydrolase
MTDATALTDGTGPTNSIVDVAGIGVGHATRHELGWLTGVTVVVPPPEGAVAGVDVRGGGPGTRETDLLDPRNSVQRVHAVVLTGGSAFGLATADGVMQGLAADGIGYEAGGTRVPIVPAAVIFDLGRSGSFEARPGADLGAQAYAAARAATGAARGRPATGVVGAGTGAVAGGLKGGVGTASAVLPDGTRVGALVVVNAAGSTVDPSTGELYAARFAVGAEFGSLQVPSPAEVQAAADAATRTGHPRAPSSPGTATTLAVVATDATLTKAACAKVAGVAHDGMARAIRPVHSMFDGDTVFALATGDPGQRDAPDRLAMHGLLTAAADTVTRAIGQAMLAADTVHTPAGHWRSYRETFPSAFARR